MTDPQHPIKCPRCGKPAPLFAEDALIGLTGAKRGNVYRCETCTTPFCGIGDTLNYAPFQFLSDGREVI